jgi:hypothetical protein
MDLCNDLVKPSVEATATLDNDSALQASNMTHPLIETHHRRCTLKIDLSGVVLLPTNVRKKWVYW